MRGKPTGGLTHGLSRTTTYKSWQAMWTRCNNVLNANYRRYGARGISVCERWRSFENFVQDMGLRPAGTSLDRKDTLGNYEPSNCRWATRPQQDANTRRSLNIRTLDDEPISIRQMARYLAVPDGTFYAHFRKRLAR